RSSSPKLNALNTSLISTLSGYNFAEARADRSHWERLVESAVGAHLCNSASDNCQVQYWRESPEEVDFVLHDGNRLAAIEVKSSKVFAKPKGLERFSNQYKHACTLIVGEGGISLAEFLTQPAKHWLE